MLSGQFSVVRLRRVSLSALEPVVVRLARLAFISSLALTAGLATACRFDPNGGGASTIKPPPINGHTTPPVIRKPCTGQCTDFPSTPILADGVPANAPTMFSGGGNGAGPCITEPEDGTLFPANWLRPRVKVSGAPAGATLQIVIHSDLEANDLVVYASGDTWTMDRVMWQDLASHVQDSPLTVTVRAATSSGSTSASKSSFTIAPVGAGGKLVYWALRGFDASKVDATELFGFAVGDESVVSALKVKQVQQQGRQGSSVSCIGCHTATPDGSFVGFTDNYPWGNAIASVQDGHTGEAASFLGQPGVSTLTNDWHGILTFTSAHWATGDHIAVTSQSTQALDPHAKLVWMELDSGASGEIARNGDPNGAAAPAFSHDGATIVYTSTNANQDGRLGVGTADLYTVPFNNRAGGTASKVSGAAEDDAAEFFPSFSPDDSFIAFNHLPASEAGKQPTSGKPYEGGMYFNPAAEVWVVATDGGKAMRLRANEPPSCTPKVIPNAPVFPGKQGWDNSWPKWSPEIGVFGAKKYYWLIFSSYRYDVSPPRGQLYMTAVVTTETSVETFPAVYLWNQDLSTSNHTPAWDTFDIPIVP